MFKVIGSFVAFVLLSACGQPLPARDAEDRMQPAPTCLRNDASAFVGTDVEPVCWASVEDGAVSVQLRSGAFIHGDPAACSYVTEFGTEHAATRGSCFVEIDGDEFTVAFRFSDGRVSRRVFATNG